MTQTSNTPTTQEAAAPYAVVATGGKQYVVRQGSVLTVEKLAGEAGGQVTLSDVLAVHDGKALSVGRPHVAGAQVLCQVVAQQRAPKVVSYKYKRRKGFHWTRGHRQSVTRLKVLQVTHGQ